MSESFSLDFYNRHDSIFSNFKELETISTITNPASPEQYHSEVIQNGKKCHLCTFPGCGKIFKFKSEITRHVIIHFAERPFVCPVEDCHKAFKRADALENHCLLHSQEFSFSCYHPDCDLKFLTRSALKYHMLKHETQKLFVCNFEGCGKSFLTKAQLKQHDKAENFHKKISIINHGATLDYPKPAKKFKGTADDTLSYTLENYTTEPVSKFASGTIYSSDFTQAAAPLSRSATSSGQMMRSFSDDQDFVEAQPSFNQAVGVQEMFNFVLEENKALKKQLDFFAEMMEVFQENQPMKEQSPNVVIAEENFQCGLQFIRPEPIMSNLVGGGTYNFMNFC